MANASVLNVLLGGIHVADLALINGRVYFSFTEGYLADPGRAILSQSFTGERDELRTHFKSKTTRLEPFFSNLLPEGSLREYLAARAGVSPDREYYLLAALGRDLPGAVEVRWQDQLDEPVDDEFEPDATGRPQRPLRFSLAGVQLKFSAIMAASGGLTIPATGEGGDWIVKLPSPNFENVPLNEFSMMQLASNIGIDVPEHYLMPVEQIEGLPAGMGRMEQDAFVVRRFDRTPTGRVHMEDFAQVFGVYPDEKYEKASYRNLLEVIAAECAEDTEEFVRRLVFNMLIGNSDMHLKNWTLLYSAATRARLAPAYDFVSTICYLGDKEAALKVSRSRRFDEFSIDELRHLAAKARVPEALVVDTARETSARFNEVWAQERTQLPLSEIWIQKIDAHRDQVPLR